MKKQLLVVFLVFIILSCHKTVPSSIPTTTPAPPIMLSHPTTLDTLYDWVRIGRVAVYIEDIWFTANRVGFITDNSNLYTSTDNGNTWTMIDNTNHPDIFNLQFIDDQNGFAQGSNELGITSDGGKTWLFRQLPSNAALYFQFINATTGFYLDPQSGLRKTIDAGNSWTTLLIQNQPYQQNFPFYFLDSATGFSMNAGNFNKLTNGGNTSTTLASGVTIYGQGFYKMQFIDSLTGFSASPRGLIKTIDGGKTWVNCLSSNTTFMIPYFLDSNNGYCIDSNIIYKTLDGGSDWTISCKLTNDSFSGFHFLDMNTGWAGTFGGFVLRLK
jgi:photosystem II stability/assembly factor-like uncharacterized protein